MLLTVVIVTKNPGIDIYPTLSSLLSLNDRSVEILIKDNSDDKSLDKINHCFRFTNFRYIHSQDKGIYDAMNQAIGFAKGKYIYFLNAGDTYVDCELLKTLRNDRLDSDFYYGNIINLHPFVRKVSYSKYVNKYSVYIRRVCHQAIVVKKEAFEHLGVFDTTLKTNADHLFIMKLFDRFRGKALGQLITIYKGSGYSTEYTLTKSERAHFRNKLKNLFNPLEMAFLSVGSFIVRILVFLKNINKPT